MKVMLKDLPGARDFFNTIVTEAENVAIAMTGEPDHKVEASRRESRENLKRKLAPLIGPEAAAGIADIFCGLVVGQRREREALAAMGLL